MNFGTVGAHHLPVGTVLSINEITSAGRIFDPNPMLTDHFSVPAAQGLPTATLFSSDSFVSPSVYTADYLQRIM